MTRIIGITGGIATGKSTVSNYLLKLGYPVVDCDQLTQTAYIDCLAELKKAFPDCIEHEMVNRAKLAARVFSQPSDKRRLEAIIHPYCRQKMTEAIIAATTTLLFLDIPLLYEAKMEDLCDEIWVVYIPHDLQLTRLISRNHYDLATAALRVDSQMNIEEKKRRADFVLFNEGTKEALYRQINRRLEEYHE